MKNRAGTDILLVVLASLIAIAATGRAQSTPGKVEIKNDYVIVHPGAKISKPDADSLDAVLRQYDKSLYKIEVYNKGRTSNSLGSLRDMCVDARTVAELTQAKAQGQSERAIQLIAPSGPPQAGSTVNPNNGTPMPRGSVSPVNPNMSPVNPTMSPVNPQVPQNTDLNTEAPAGPLPSGPQMQNTPMPAGPQQSTPNGSPQTAVTGQVPQVVVNPNQSTQCAPTDPKAAEFLQKVKTILQKYSG